MKTVKGIAGFLLLIFGGVFINAPIIALLAILLLIAGAYLVTVHYLSYFETSTTAVKAYKILVVIGVILTVFLMAICVITYTDYLALADRTANPAFDGGGEGQPVRFPFTDILTNGALNVIFALAISYLLKKGTRLSWEGSLLRGLPLAFLIPLTLWLVRMLARQGFPILG